MQPLPSTNRLFYYNVLAMIQGTLSLIAAIWSALIIDNYDPLREQTSDASAKQSRPHINDTNSQFSLDLETWGCAWRSMPSALKRMLSALYSDKTKVGSFSLVRTDTDICIAVTDLLPTRTISNTTAARPASASTLSRSMYIIRTSDISLLGVTQNPYIPRPDSRSGSDSWDSGSFTNREFLDGVEKSYSVVSNFSLGG